MATRPSQKPGTPRNVQSNLLVSLLVSLQDTYANLFRLQDLLKNKCKSRWIWSFATSPCVGLVAGRRELRSKTGTKPVRLRLPPSLLASLLLGWGCHPQNWPGVGQGLLCSRFQIQNHETEECWKLLDSLARFFSFEQDFVYRFSKGCAFARRHV